MEIEIKGLLRNVGLLFRSFVLDISKKMVTQKRLITVSFFCVEIAMKRVTPEHRITLSVFCIANSDEMGPETSD